MPAPIEKDPQPRKQYSKAPEGTYRWLEQYSGFERGDSRMAEGETFSTAFKSPLLVIRKEEVCKETGGSCMAFRLIRNNEGDGCLDFHGHITDQDEIVFLYIDIFREGIRSSFPQQTDINRAISEIRALVPPQQDTSNPE